MKFIFKENFDDIFRIEVENHSGSKFINRKEFWDKLYVARVEEQEKFNAFIHSNAKLLLLTGFVGAGKSTFIRAMYEKYRMCNGIVIDFRGHATRFTSHRETIVEATVEKILKESLLNLLREDIKYKLHFDLHEFKEYHYNPYADLKKISFEEWHSIELNFKASLELFRLSMKYLHTDEDIMLLTYKYSMIPRDNDYETWSNDCVNKAKSEPSILSDFYKLLKWTHLLHLLSILLNDKKPIIITFDNVDALKFNRIQDHFLDALINVGAAANNRLSDGNIARFNVSPVKIILNVRDENISRLNLSAAGTERNLQIQLNERSHDFELADDIIYINKEKSFFYNIINLRLNIIKEKLNIEELEPIIRFIKFHILDSSSKILKQGENFLNIKQVANESIRLMLDLISDLTFDLVGNERDIYGEIFSQIPTHALQGKLISFLWNFDSTRELLQSIGNSLLKELSYDSKCSSYRMILTKLYNSTEKSITLKELLDSLGVLGIDENETKHTLYNLFHHSTRESEIISIYQKKMIESENHLSFNTKIRLNLKGEHFLNSIFKSIDFFGRTTEKYHKIKNKCLIELPVEKAYVYVNEIYQLVSKLFKFHKYFLINNIYPKCKNHPTFFYNYQKNYCVGKAFYLERVCSSHINSIKYYLFEILKGDNCKLLLKKTEKKELSIYKKIVSNDIEFTDEYLNELIKDFDKNDVIIKLFNIVQKYESIYKDMYWLKTIKRIPKKN